MKKLRHATIPFTQPAYDEMLARQATLQEQQQAVMLRLKEAREQGDLSENGAYKYAKFELGNNRRELARLNRLITNGYVPMKRLSTANAQFGNTVTIANDKSQFQFMLVSKYESDPAHNKLSEDSPIGAAVIGRSVGETIRVTTPSGLTSYKILAIE